MKALEGNLSTRLEGDEKRIAGLENDSKEMAAHINAVEKKTNDNASEIATVRTELTGNIAKVDAKASDALNAARNAQSGADKANASISSLEAMLRNRNNYEVIEEKQIPFSFNSSRLAEDYEAPLNELAKQLKENSDTFVVLEGHTDNVGDAAYNIQLGQKRNEAVTRFLIVTSGVPMYQVYETSFGEDQPVAANNSKDGREKNRSVVLRVYRAKNAAAAAR
jgi:outer membrane protein OmpA-like peptidoglycan-associated protein